MNPTTKYEMTQADLETLLDACKPTRVMMIGSYTGSSPQENANRAWEALGKKMGFDYMTVRPDGSDPRFFFATPTETDAQKQVRIEREQAEAKAAEIAKIHSEIQDRESRLKELGAL